jgi:ATP-binding cassette subfamily C protein LapB
MDNKTESGLKRRLAEIIQGKTCILITHRASMLDIVDRVVVLDSGQIIADGPKESVMDDLKSGHLSF